MGLETLSDRNIGLPVRRMIPVTPPYSNTVLDLSEYYGEPLFEERTLQYSFVTPSFESKEALNEFYAYIQQWLYSPTGKAPLVDCADRFHYYLAQVVDAPTRAEMADSGTITISFKAYPFRIGLNEEGDDIWDSFSFLTGISQKTSFNVYEILYISLFNNGQPNEVPTVTTSDNITIKNVDGKSFVFPAGNNDQSLNDDPLIIAHGKNNFTIYGNATVSFHWRSEVI